MSAKHTYSTCFLLPLLTDLLTHEMLTKPSISIKLLSFNKVSFKDKMSKLSTKLKKSLSLYTEFKL